MGSIVLGVAAGTVASIGILFALDKDKTLCKKNSIGDKVDELKDQIDSFTRKMRDKSMELKGTLEEKVAIFYQIQTVNLKTLLSY